MPSKSPLRQRTPRPRATSLTALSHYLEEEQRSTQWAVLYQSPLWILPVASVMLSGSLHQWNDSQYLAFATLVALPAAIVPTLSPHWQHTPGPKPTSFYQTYSFHLNLYISILVCFGTYFGTHYFFDLMGMRYSFNVKWNFASDVVGRRGCGEGEGRQEVPMFMYPLTHAYFMTYFTALMVVERGVVKWWRLGRLGWLGRVGVIVGLSYGLAFLETWVMASPLLEGVFSYESRERMLRVGSLGYASYFVVGLPMVKRVDRGERWTLERVMVEALATCMMILVLLEGWAKVVGQL